MIGHHDHRGPIGQARLGDGVDHLPDIGIRLLDGGEGFGRVRSIAMLRDIGVADVQERQMRTVRADDVRREADTIRVASAGS